MRRHEKPFFLYLPYTLPHADVFLPHDEVYDRYVKKFNEKPIARPAGAGHHYDPQPHAAFAAMVSRLDRFVGEIMNVVTENGLDENTLVIFTSDNGPHKERGGDPDFFNSNAGLRGIKRDLYEGGIRVPFIAYHKGVTKAGSVNTTPAALWDLFPTFLQLVSMPVPHNTDGISLLPAFRGKSQWQHDYFYWELHEAGGKQAVRLGDWKAVRLNVSDSAINAVELYDLNNDPKEKNNLAAKRPDLVKRMEAIMKEAHVFNPGWLLTVEEKSMAFPENK
jgi:arylsulfatase A-like enzyme